jgi:hypothetical protein
MDELLKELTSFFLFLFLEGFMSRYFPGNGNNFNLPL